MAHQPQPPRQPPRPQPQRSAPERQAHREADRDEREQEREAEREERQAERNTPPAAEGPEDPQAAAPLPVPTVVDEQRARSLEIQQMGVEAWKAAHDERDPADKPKTVPGVSTHGDARNLEAGSWGGSTRSTPPARAAQNPAAPR